MQLAKFELLEEKMRFFVVEHKKTLKIPKEDKRKTDNTMVKGKWVPSWS